MIVEYRVALKKVARFCSRNVCI